MEKKSRSKDWVMHPNYSYQPNYDNDYALFVLECATTQDIKLVRLNSDENFPAVGSVARIMGWGRHYTPKRRSLE
jgi:hypothetical protein